MNSILTKIIAIAASAILGGCLFWMIHNNNAAISALSCRVVENEKAVVRIETKLDVIIEMLKAKER